MRSAKFVEAHHYPLEDLDPSIGPCVYKKGLLNSNLKGSQASFQIVQRGFSIVICVFSSGHKVLVRCLRLLKPYSKKSIAEDDIDEDDDDEDYSEAGRALPVEGRIMEQDMLSQAYNIGMQKRIRGVREDVEAFFCVFIISRKETSVFHVLKLCFCAFSPVLSCGSKGIPQSGLKFRMNIGKLEARMICRRLEKEGVIKVRPTQTVGLCRSCVPHFQISQLEFGL